MSWGVEFRAQGIACVVFRAYRGRASGKGFWTQG